MELFPGLVLRRGLLGGLKVLCAALGSDGSGKIGRASCRERVFGYV